MALLRRTRAFRNLWLAQAGSWFGGYFNKVALAAATLDLTHSAAAMGLVLLAGGLPAFIFGPLWGPLIDRWPKRAALYGTDLVRAVVALTFIVAYAGREVWLLYLGSALLPTCTSLFQPARRVAVRLVVPVDDLVEANAVGTASAGFVAVLGAAGGGLVSACVSPDVAFAVNAASYLGSALWIFATLWEERTGPGGVGAGYLSQLAAGTRALAGNRVALPAVVASLGFALTSGPFFVAPPVLGDLVYGMGSLGISLLFVADGVGFIVSSALLARVRPRRLRAVYGGSYFVQAVFLCLLCLSTRLWEGTTALLFRSQGWRRPCVTHWADTAPEIQGRIFAVQAAASSGMGQLSIAASGWVMAAYGVGAVGVPVGLICVMAGALWLGLTAGEPALAAA